MPGYSNQKGQLKWYGPSGYCKSTPYRRTTAVKKRIQSVKESAILIAILLCPFLWAESDSLKPIAVFVRCYGQITQTRPLPTNPLYLKVSQGKMDPIEACLSLLDGAALASSGATEGMLNVVSSENRATLKTFNDFHRTWFPSDNIDNTTLNLTESAPNIRNIHDISEAALHVTRALFSPNVLFSEVVTGGSAMEALRTGGLIENESANNQYCYKYTSTTSLAGGNFCMFVHSNPPTAIHTQLVQRGDLVGVRKLTLNTEKNNAQVVASLTGSAISSGTPTATFSLNGHFGGGALGTQPYLLLNSGRVHNETMDGGVVLPRRWSQAVYNDFLCRSLPVIRYGDAAPYVQSAASVTSQTPPFRSVQSCMQCHASMDSMASTARNISAVPVPSYLEDATSQYLVGMYSYPATVVASTKQVDKDPNFHRETPLGRFMFRTYDGQLINDFVVGIAKLGQAISKTDDYYLCAASRYLQFFTGISVPLGDVGNQPALTEDQKYYLSVVVSLGKRLRADPKQSLRTLIQSILELPLYQNPSLRAEVPLTGGH